jgi:hypothetical protein
MSFTNSDLARLKKDINLAPVDAEIIVSKCSALLARLDCGERLIKVLKNKENVTEEEIAWEKSCGLL